MPGYIAHVAKNPTLHIKSSYVERLSLSDGSVANVPVPGRRIRDFSPLSGGVEVAGIVSTQTGPQVATTPYGGDPMVQPVRAQHDLPLARSMISLDRALEQVNRMHPEEDHWTEKELVEALEKFPSHGRRFSVVSDKGKAISAEQLANATEVQATFEEPDSAHARKYKGILDMGDGRYYCTLLDVVLEDSDELEKHVNSAKRKAKLPKRKPGRPPAKKKAASGEEG